MSLAPMTTLSALCVRFDTFFVDQFGVLRDDDGAYAGANQALLHLKALGKTVIILSNSGRSGDYNAERFVKLGFDRGGFDRFLTSGDVAHAVLKQELTASPAARRCLTISSGDDRNLAERLGFASVEAAADADIVIISGSEAESISLDAYRDRLLPAACRGVPCVCTNPDRDKLVKGGGTAPGAGAIAALYEELGGSVRWFGKPFPDIYSQALSLVPTSAERIVCIGDSIEHDIAGAAGAGLASCLVRTGILADAVPADLEAVAGLHRAWPDYLMQAFVV
ncbi:TIGR01459 family HAD-type hydrolase [Rhizobium sp. RU36D]|uniref:TIGR01459 family HAD-type hydrolase n=1 Tax=Rhizobium sp. RU36D TaxID=1907415 RepID=UPI0009D87B4C|nr:TIGR01459 family HAD-type hydrolase [Rhizobium sp. RU36D]SMC49065.1 HAD-superfamily class IIA hydrolase, TIGR01459 [Rhizobium sp. RU36D]